MDEKESNRLAVSIGFLALEIGIMAIPNKYVQMFESIGFVYDSVNITCIVLLLVYVLLSMYCLSYEELAYKNVISIADAIRRIFYNIAVNMLLYNAFFQALFLGGRKLLGEGIVANIVLTILALAFFLIILLPSIPKKKDKNRLRDRNDSTGKK